MLDPLSRGVTRLVPGGGWSSFEEIAAPQGVVDVVRVRFRPSVIAERKSHRLAAAADASSVLVLTQAGSQFTAAEASRVTGLSSGHLSRKVLPRLLDGGWLQRDGSRWLRTVPYRIPVSRLATVELKRNDWKTALWQAARHVAYADYSWAVFDGVAASSIRKAEKVFLHAGVGVAFVWTWPTGCRASASTLSVEIRPSVAAWDRVGRAILAERCLELYQLGQSRGKVSHVFGQDLSVG